MRCTMYCQLCTLYNILNSSCMPSSKRVLYPLAIVAEQPSPLVHSTQCAAIILPAIDPSARDRAPGPAPGPGPTQARGQTGPGPGLAPGPGRARRKISHGGRFHRHTGRLYWPGGHPIYCMCDLLHLSYLFRMSSARWFELKVY